MRVVVQRVLEASVVVSGTAVASISKGLLLLLGITHTDTEEDIDWLVKKISQLRIFEDASGQMNASLQEVQGELILVSQFTLFAATKKVIGLLILRRRNRRWQSRFMKPLGRPWKRRLVKKLVGVYLVQI